MGNNGYIIWDSTSSSLGGVLNLNWNKVGLVMNLSSKSELNGLGGILEELCADTAHRGWSSQVELDEAKNKVLQLALSCLPKRVPLEDALSYDIVNQIYGQNAAIDTIEAQIKLKFGGK